RAMTVLAADVHQLRRFADADKPTVVSVSGCVTLLAARIALSLLCDKDFPSVAVSRRMPRVRILRMAFRARLGAGNPVCTVALNGGSQACVRYGKVAFGQRSVVALQVVDERGFFCQIACHLGGTDRLGLKTFSTCAGELN